MTAVGRVPPMADAAVREGAPTGQDQPVTWSKGLAFSGHAILAIKYCGLHSNGLGLMRAYAVLLLSLVSLTVAAAEYGHYDLKKVVSLSETTPGKPSATINMPLFVEVLNDLGSHAGTYPVHFDNGDDRQRAEHDVAFLSSVLDTTADNFNDRSILLRLALLHFVGHNLDIPGSGEKAVAVFDNVLAKWPNDPQANYRYGLFLASTVKYRDAAIPRLEKAKALGVVDADYTLGLTYLSLGEKEKAITNLKSYTARVPGDENAARILDAAINGKIETKQLSRPRTVTEPRIFSIQL